MSCNTDIADNIENAEKAKREEELCKEEEGVENCIVDAKDSRKKRKYRER